MGRTNMKKENSFDSIEVKFRILRRDKPEPELDSSIIIHKGKESQSIELFNKDCLTEFEKEKLDWIEEVQQTILSWRSYEITDGLIDFIKEVEKDPSIYYKSWYVVVITKDEFDNIPITSMKTDIKDKFENVREWIWERAHEYSKVTLFGLKKKKSSRI